LKNATFEKANITSANLKNAILEGAFFSNTILSKGEDPLPSIEGADFTDVGLRKDVQKTLCSIASGVNPTTGNATRDTLFCD